MALTKNSMNPCKFETLEQLKFVQEAYFSTHTNTALSYKQKMEIIHLICFMTQVLKTKDKTMYPNAVTVLEQVFNINLRDNTDKDTSLNESIRAFGMICDDLMWGAEDKIEKPEGISNLKDIKNKIITYFNDEWMPF
jgi:hypothetical protein